MYTGYMPKIKKIRENTRHWDDAERGGRNKKEQYFRRQQQRKLRLFVRIYANASTIKKTRENDSLDGGEEQKNKTLHLMHMLFFHLKLQYLTSLLLNDEPRGHVRGLGSHEVNRKKMTSGSLGR
eukprot:GEMP01090767.1.p1 GENE.GEMP01090767.1~~GEMP01090767.1.p1  ORF type:complete len:124 (-),score=6.13 GEMP01090767.1:141-512(-)